MLIKRAYQYRIYPNQEQQEKLAKQFGASRFVYNYFLRQRIDHYAATGQGLTYHETALQLTLLKQCPGYVWLDEAHSQVMQQALRDLDTAYNNFFNHRADFPTFKKKHGKQSCRFPQGHRLEGKKVYVPKVGWIKLMLHRPIQANNVKSLTVSKTKSGKYFASFQVEQDTGEPGPTYQGGQIGIDLGLKDFVVTSDNDRYPAPKYLRQSERQLKRLQRKLSRTEQGSHGREKARLKVARQHEKIANQRKDFLHKLSRKLVEENQLIVIEDLHIKGMVKNHHLAKSISDASWSEFARQLGYKGHWYGCHIGQHDRFVPSSKRHFQCGYIYEGLTLSERQWWCPECQVWVDRDHNAAQNILNWYRVGATRIYAAGQMIRPGLPGTSG